jgi:hypothetical protein
MLGYKSGNDLSAKAEFIGRSCITRSLHCYGPRASKQVSTTTIGIYKGTIPIGLLTNGSHNDRAKAQLVFYPDGRLLVLSVKSPQARNPIEHQGYAQKECLHRRVEKRVFWERYRFPSGFPRRSAVAAVTGKNGKSEKWYVSKSAGSAEKKKSKTSVLGEAASGREMGGAGLKKKWTFSEEKPSN